jgi:hypothetical protein
METSSAEGIFGWKRRNVVNRDLVIYYRVQSQNLKNLSIQSTNMNGPLICSEGPICNVEISFNFSSTAIISKA